VVPGAYKGRGENKNPRKMKKKKDAWKVFAPKGKCHIEQPRETNKKRESGAESGDWARKKENAQNPGVQTPIIKQHTGEKVSTIVTSRQDTKCIRQKAPGAGEEGQRKKKNEKMGWGGTDMVSGPSYEAATASEKGEKLKKYRGKLKQPWQPPTMVVERKGSNARRSRRSAYVEKRRENGGRVQIRRVFD